MKKAISFFILILLLLTAGTPFAVSAENDSADLTIERIVLTSPDTLYVIFSEPVNIVDRNDIAFFWGWNSTTGEPGLVDDNFDQPAECAVEAVTDTIFRVTMYFENHWPNNYFWDFYSNPQSELYGRMGVGVKELGTRNENGYIESITSKDGTRMLKANGYTSEEADTHNYSKDIECHICTSVTYEDSFSPEPPAPSKPDDALVIPRVILVRPDTLYVEFSEPVAEIRRDDFTFFWGWYQTNAAGRAVIDNFDQPPICSVDAVTDTLWKVQMYYEAGWPNNYYWDFYNNKDSDIYGRIGVGIKETGTKNENGFVDSISSKDGSKQLWADGYTNEKADTGTPAADIECALCLNVEYDSEFEQSLTPPTEPASSGSTTDGNSNSASQNSAPVTGSETGVTDKNANLALPVIIICTAAVITAVVVVIIVRSKKKN